MTMITENEVDQVHFEEPFLDQGGWKNAPPRSFKSEALRWGFPTVIAMACTKQGVLPFPVAITTWRSLIGAPTQAPKSIKDTDGRRAWLKAATLERTRKLGYDPKSEDEADALGIWLAVVKLIEDKAAQPDLFSNATR
jgi:hypothetical protein